MSLLLPKGVLPCLSRSECVAFILHGLRENYIYSSLLALNEQSCGGLKLPQRFSENDKMITLFPLMHLGEILRTLGQLCKRPNRREFLLELVKRVLELLLISIIFARGVWCFCFMLIRLLTKRSSQIGCFPFH